MPTTTEKIAARRAAARKGASSTAAKAPAKRATAKAKPAKRPQTLEAAYEFAALTKNKVRFDAVDPDGCHGMDRVYVNKDALGGVASEKDAPASLTVTVTVG